MTSIETRPDWLRRAAISDFLARRARRESGREALVVETADGERVALTYEELNGLVNRMASLFSSNGIGRGDVIAGMCANGADQVVAYYASLKIGAAFTGINPSLTRGEALRQIGHAEPDLILCEQDPNEYPEHVQKRILPTATGSDAVSKSSALHQELMTHSPEDPPESAFESDLAMLVYTSGTESEPKGVRILHRAFLLATTPAWLMDRYIEPDDRFLLLAPMYTMAGLGTITNLISAGATVVIATSTSPDRVAAIIEREHVSNLSQTPTFYKRLVDSAAFNQANLGAVRQCHTYGGAIPRSVVEAFREKANQVRWATYWGQTELSQLGAIGFYCDPSEIPDRDPRWVGKPVPHIEVRVIDDDGRESEVGELICRSPAVMDGYHKAPELTGHTIRDGWLHTGDIVRIDESFNMFFHDRKKDVIKTGGMNVSSLEVENALSDIDGIEAVAVIGLPDEHWSEAVTAFVVAQDGRYLDPNQLLAMAKERLAPYKVPKSIRFVDELPRDKQGKILKREIRDRQVG